jgi:hypothetical protein
MSDGTFKTAVCRMVGSVCRLKVRKQTVVREIVRETSLSRSLDTTDKFDIGLYDLVSSGSRSDFFSMGVM